jgi:hypothetical protein
MISSGVYRFFGMMRPPWLRSSLTFILDQFYPGRSEGHTPVLDIAVGDFDGTVMNTEGQL